MQHGFGLGAVTGGHQTPVASAQQEQGRRCWLVRNAGQCLAGLLFNLLFQGVARGGLAQSFGDHVDLVQHTFQTVVLAGAHNGHTGGLQLFKHAGRTGVFGGQNQIRLQRQDALYRQLTHVAHLRQLLGFGRVTAGGINAHQLLLLAQCINDFGDRAVNTDDPLALLRGGSIGFGGGQQYGQPQQQDGCSQQFFQIHGVGTHAVCSCGMSSLCRLAMLCSKVRHSLRSGWPFSR